MKTKRIIIVILLIALALLAAAMGIIWNKIARVRTAYTQIEETAGESDDFESLRKANPEVIAWLTVADTGIDTPVTQTDDNIKYLTTDVRGGSSFAGNPFLDHRNSPDFTDPYSIIYGHDMEDHMMFGDLQLFTNSGFWEEERTGTLMLPDAAYTIRFFAAEKAREGDSRVLDPVRVKNNWNEEYLGGLLSDAVYAGEQIQTNDNILVLATCLEAGTDDRLLVFGKLDKQGE